MRYVGLEHIVKGDRVLLNSAPSSFSDGTNGMFEPGDILFGKLRPNLRKSVWVATKGFCSTDLLVLRPIEGVEPRFAAHVASSEVVFNQAERHSFGTKMPRTSWRAVAQSVVFVPPLDEQRRIAEILDAIDETIQATERVIAKLTTTRAGLVDRFLDFEERASTRLGAVLERIDGGWSPVCAETPPSGAQWGVLKVSSVTRESFKPRESKTLPSALPPRVELVVRAGDVITARANGVADLVGRTAFVESCDGLNLLLSDKTLRLVPKAELSGRYLTYCMQHEIVRSQIRGMVSGSTGQGNITQAEIRSLRIPLPEFADQLCIEAAISAQDRMIYTEKRHIEHLARVRTGLAADLLSGRVCTVAS